MIGIGALGPAIVTTQFANGTISFHRAARGDGVFVAMCGCRRHRGDPLCMRERTAEKGRAKAQGLPLGHLAAWLADAEKHANRASHMDQRDYARATRLEARGRLRRVDARLFAHERPWAPGDYADIEPFRNP